VTFIGGQPDPGHPAAVQRADHQPPSVKAHLVADRRQPLQAGHQEAAERLVRTGRQCEAGTLGEVGEVEQTVHFGRYPAAER